MQVNASTQSRVLFVLWTALFLANFIRVLAEFLWAPLLLSVACVGGAWTQWGKMRSSPGRCRRVSGAERSTPRRRSNRSDNRGR